MAPSLNTAALCDAIRATLAEHLESDLGMIPARRVSVVAFGPNRIGIDVDGFGHTLTLSEDRC